MTPAYTIYTSESCPFCINAKKVLELKNLSYKEIDVSTSLDAKDFVREQWANKGVSKPTVPLILHNTTNQVIGGYEDLLKHLTQA